MKGLPQNEKIARLVRHQVTEIEILLDKMTLTPSLNEEEWHLYNEMRAKLSDVRTVMDKIIAGGSI